MSERCETCGRIEWAETCWRDKVRAIEAERDEAIALLRDAYQHMSGRYALRGTIGDFLDGVDARAKATPGTGDR